MTLCWCGLIENQRELEGPPTESQHTSGSVCGTSDRANASDLRALRFESSQWQLFTSIHVLLNVQKTKNEKAKIGSVYKKITVIILCFNKFGADVINNVGVAKLCYAEIKHSDWLKINMGLVTAYHGALF